MNSPDQEVDKKYKMSVSACMMGLITICISIVLAYLPVLLAWNNGYAVIDQSDRRQLTIALNWFMKLAPSIYVPLLKWHAKISGWDCKEVYNLGDSECIAIFNSNDNWIK